MCVLSTATNVHLPHLTRRESDQTGRACCTQVEQHLFCSKSSVDLSSFLSCLSLPHQPQDTLSILTMGGDM